MFSPSKLSEESSQRSPGLYSKSISDIFKSSSPIQSKAAFDDSTNILSETFVEENQIYMEDSEWSLLDAKELHNEENHQSSDDHNSRKRKSTCLEPINSSSIKKTKLTTSPPFMDNFQSISPIKNTSLTKLAAKSDEQENNRSCNNNEPSERTIKVKFCIGAAKRMEEFELFQLGKYPKLKKLKLDRNIAIVVSNEENAFKSRGHIDCWQWNKASKGHGKKVDICSNNCKEKESGCTASKKKWICRGSCPFNIEERFCCNYRMEGQDALVILYINSHNHEPGLESSNAISIEQFCSNCDEENVEEVLENCNVNKG